MKKYLTKFSTRAEYTAALENLDFPNVTYLSEDDEMVFSKAEPETDWSKEYLTFLALEDGTFSRNGGFMYRIGDGTTWGEWTLANDETTDETTTIGTTPLIHAGEKVQFYRGGGGGERFTSTGRFEAMGNINSLVWGTNLDNLDLFNDAHTLQKTFSNCTGLTSAENLVLPATGLIESCYKNMFYGCTNLVKAPKVLPATTLGNDCYDSMFMGCTSLTTAPELPATTLAQTCYYCMFNGCTSLNYIKMLATDVSASNHLYEWVSGVASSGTFVKHPNAKLPSGASGIPTGWTVETATA